MYEQHRKQVTRCINSVEDVHNYFLSGKNNHKRNGICDKTENISSENACICIINYYPFYKILIIRIYKTNLPVGQYGCEKWPLTFRDQ